MFNIIYLTNFANIKWTLCDNEGVWQFDCVTTQTVWRFNRDKFTMCQVDHETS